MGTAFVKISDSYVLLGQPTDVGILNMLLRNLVVEQLTKCNSIHFFSKVHAIDVIVCK